MRFGKYIILVVALCLTACSLEIPSISSGDVVVYENGHVLKSSQLSASNAAAVSAWLRKNSSGWQNYIATPSAQVSAKLVATDRTRVDLYILGTTVIVNFRETQSSQSFSTEQIQQLREALGV